MRGSILLWSTFSGVLLGIFADALVLGVWLVLSAIMPGASNRAVARPLVVLGAVVFTLLPLIGAVLGFLEGRLKAN